MNKINVMERKNKVAGKGNTRVKYLKIKFTTQKQYLSKLHALVALNFDTYSK